MRKSKKKASTHDPAVVPVVVAVGMSEEHQKHLREGYRLVRNAYSFLSANNARHALEQLRAGLSNFDRVLAPWA